MLNFCSLYSGSSGNSLFVQSENTNLLVDCGVSAKKIETALTDLNINPNSIDGILITHEHSDHVQGLGVFAKKFNVPVFVNKQTLDAMPKQKEKLESCNANITNFEVGDHLEIKNLKIKSFSIPHDAANPCGFTITDNCKTIGIATDIGHMTTDILKELEPSDFLLLESNYDPEVLKCSPYPYHLKQRIAGPNGHLPNEMAGKTISYLLKSNLKKAMLGHLSKENNFPELAYKSVVEELISNSYDENSLSLSVASRDVHGKIIQI
ncbi:MAG: MBL fold metallo-hydrolase [Clostridia bacterium]|nr:MBL fold metallo-hydrolase [Clostridia bacterium]